MITNQFAAEKVRDLALDYEKLVLDALGELPISAETVTLPLLSALHASVTPVREGTILAVSTETVELTADFDALPDDETRAALHELTLNGTAALGEGFTLADVEARQQKCRADLVERRAQLSRPLGLRGRSAKASEQRREAWADHLRDALAAFDALPVPPARFPALLDAVLAVAGLRQSAGGYAIIDAEASESAGPLDASGQYTIAAVAQRTAKHAAALDARHETIVVWAFEASHGEGGSPDEDFELGPRRRYRAALAEKQAATEKTEAERVEREHRETVERLRELAADRARQRAENAGRVRREIERMQRKGVDDDQPEDQQQDDDGMSL